MAIFSNMKKAAKILDFERAAEIRDKHKKLREMVDNYIKGYEARAKVEKDELVAVVGGEDNFKKIYNIYCDVVSKNPFYEIDMPIRSKRLW